MSDLTSAEKAGKVYGPTLERYRSIVPLALLLYWIQMETGWYRLALSIDRKLLESGWSQIPLAQAWKRNCDPWDTVGALWLACVECLDDIAYWRGSGTLDAVRLEIGTWLEKNDRSLWWVVQADYSVGTGALRHILTSAISRAVNHNRGPEDRGLLVEVLDWAAVTNLADPVHARHWGRQTPRQIGERIIKHRDWIDEAAELGPLDDSPAGGLPPVVRPVDAAAFPAEMVQWAKVAARESSTEERARAYAAVRAYLKQRKAREIVPRAALLYRLRAFLARREIAEPIERAV